MRPALAALIVFAGIAAGQTAPRTDWGNLNRLVAGDDLKIRADARPPFRARFGRVTTDTLLVGASGAEESLSRPSILSVAVKTPSHRRRNALIGLAVGAGAGLAIGAVADSRTCRNGSNCLFVLPNIGKEVLTPVGAILGVTVGALLPTGRWREIYRASNP